MRHGLGKISPLFRSKEPSNGEKHAVSTTKLQEPGTVTKNTMNFGNEIISMERVRWIMLRCFLT